MKSSLALLVPFLLLALMQAGCAGRTTKPLSDTALAPSQVVIVPETPATPGSLWTNTQGGLLYDVKGRQVGDIVTVAIFERASASKEASTSAGRKSSATAGISRLFGLEKSISTINSSIDPERLISANYENNFQGSGSTSRKEDLVATITTQVVEVLPNGNLRIDGSKNVIVNNEEQIIRLAGIVRQADVSAGNVVDSKHILDARIAYTGKGVISDKQRQGWLVRVLDNITPF